MRSTLPPDSTEEASGIFVVTVALAAWAIARSRTGVIDSLVLPAPSAIIATLVANLLGFGLKPHDGTRIRRASRCSPSNCPVARRQFGPYHRFEQHRLSHRGPVKNVVPVPAIAWAPISMVWLGLGPRKISRSLPMPAFQRWSTTQSRACAARRSGFCGWSRSFGAPRLMQVATPPARRIPADICRLENRELARAGGR